MRAISQFVISVFELAEAEGRDLRAALRNEARDLHAVIVSLSLAAACLLVAVPLVIAGAWLMAAGLLWWLESQLDRPLAAVITGIALIVMAGALLLMFRSLARVKRP